MGRASQIAPAIVEETGKPTLSNHTGDGQAKKLREAIAQMAKVDMDVAKVAKQVSVSVTEEGVLIEAVDQDGGESMLFDVSSSELKPALTAFLTRLTPALS